MKLSFTMTKKINILISSLFLVFTLVIAIVTGKQFYDFRNYKTEVYVREGIKTEKLSKYFPKLEGTIGDSEIYIIEGEEEGGSLLIIGGTHPNEPAGQLTSILFLENLEVKKGKVFIITEANRSAYAHSYPQEGAPFFYTIETNYGERKFKFGARATSPSDQWPFPDVYVHKSSGQKMSSHDTRNLNRAYPGDPNGTYTEQVAYAIKELIVQNDITITIDLHEASPEYLTNNAIVAHDRAIGIADPVASMVLINYFNIKAELSPKNLRGLSHRELGDHTKSLVFLLETSNASQGKYRGRFTEDLIVTGEDKFYKKAEELGLLYAAPVHINERVGRHTQSILEIINFYNNYWVNKGRVREDGYVYQPIELANIPNYNDILNNGVGYYLKEIK